MNATIDAYTGGSTRSGVRAALAAQAGCGNRCADTGGHYAAMWRVGVLAVMAVEVA